MYRDAEAIAGLTTQWRHHHTHFPCFVSETRRFASQRPVDAELFTALGIASRLRDVAAARALTDAIAAALAARIAGDDRVHFFLDRSRLPADADCTAVAYLLLLDTERDVAAAAHRALDRIAANVDARGVVATYFEQAGDRAGIVDAVVCLNAIRLAVRLGRLGDVRASWDHVRDVLATGAYLAGTRYYPSPDALLDGFAKLADVPGAPRDELRRAVAARLGASDHPLDLAQRVMAARQVGVDASADRERLAALAQPDGTWPADGWFCYGRSRQWFGSAALTTAFALGALAADR
jgi:hypothetical protein|nr:hypothetical protein [Kofleriaceae bacterium]